MCGRFNVISDPLTKFLLEVTGQTFEMSDKYNIAPTEDVGVVRQVSNGDEAQWELETMRWWLVPSWAPLMSSKYAMFNARSETLAKSRAFSQPFKHQRCLIPASGYYEWQTSEGKKNPLYISPEKEDGLLFAGLWDLWEKGEGEALLSCTLVTKPAVGEMKSIHGRIPVMLGKNAAASWVDQNTGLESLHLLLARETDLDLNVTPVSTWVNNARHKDEDCITPKGEKKVVRI